MTVLYFRENIVCLENFGPVGQAVLNSLLTSRQNIHFILFKIYILNILLLLLFTTTLYFKDTPYTVIDMHLLSRLL